MAEEKQIVRKEMKQKKLKMSQNEIYEKSLKIEEAFMALPQYQQAKDIYCYKNFNQEVDTSLILNRACLEKKNVYLPRVEGRDMNFYKILSEKELKKGYFGILEPVGGILNTSYTGLMILPGLAFDFNGNRLGYGKGFYDRYLKKGNFIKVGLAYDFQVVDELEVKEHDQKMDVIVTEKAVYSFLAEK
jgi:5-formyltetrahydrofolate cyclo-ligase